MKKPSRHELLNIPNMMGYLRILLIPVFIYLYVSANSADELRAAAVVVAISGITDFLDGLIARKFNMITEFGMVLDPLADKLTQTAILCCLASRFPLMWAVFGIVVVRELYLLAKGLHMLRRGKSLNGSRWYGKVSTFVFYAVVLLLMIFPDMAYSTVQALIALCGALTLVALCGYLLAYRSLENE